MKTKLTKILNFFIFDLVFFLGGSATFFAVPWGLKNYPMQFNWNVFFVLSADTSGHDSGTGRSILLGFVIPAIILFIVLKVVYHFLSKKIRFLNQIKWNLVKTVYFILSVLTLIICTTMWNYLKIAKTVTGKSVDSDFYKTHCITSREFTIAAPVEKRNIIYIFMESMESDFTDIENGGVFEKNLIPNLTKLANENISFSESDFIGGGTTLQATSWTVAGLLSKLNGLPYFLPFTKVDNAMHCLKNAVSLNDVLASYGYDQIFSMGSEKQFENRDIVLEDHNVQIHDIKWYKENKLIPEDYQVFWGFEDLKLYEMAKIELNRLSASDKPFFYGLLTVDTHFPKGFVCSNCKNETDSQMDNVLLCADRQVNDFIEWIKEQSWFENTTIIITGDHNYLDAPLNNFIKKESPLSSKEILAKRKFLNVIINSAVKISKDQEKGRKFSSFDITPTLLEASGFKINGKGMYLGRSLLGKEKTLCELYTQSEIENEILKKTVQYEELK